MVVRYRVQDATGDPDREVEGRIRAHGAGQARRTRHPDRLERAGPHRRAVVDAAGEQRRRDRALPGVVDRRRLREGVPGDHVHARRPDEQREVQLHRRGREPRRPVRPVGSVGRGASRRAARHPGCADADVRRQEPERRLGHARRRPARPSSTTRSRSRRRRRRASRRRPRSSATRSCGRACRTASLTRCACRRTTSHPTRRARARGR